MGVSVAVVENLATIIGDESHTVETWTGDRFFFSAFFFWWTIFLLSESKVFVFKDCIQKFSLLFVCNVSNQCFCLLVLRNSCNNKARNVSVNNFEFQS